MNIISSRLRLWGVVGVVAVAAVSVGIGWGLAAGGESPEQTGAAAPATASPGPTATGPAQEPGGATPAQDSAGGEGQPPPPPPPPAETGPADTGPQIEMFRVTQEPRCPGGTTEFPVDGRPLVLEWRVTGTETVSLSIDGPGVYDTYPAEGSDTLSFPCGGDEGDIQRHTYLLTATGDDQTVNEELVVEAVVHETTSV